MSFQCKGCDATAVKEHCFSVEQYPILDCKKCGHQFVDIEIQPDHLNEVYGEHYFEGGKDGYPDYLKDRAMLEKRGRSYGKILRKYKPGGGSLLDVGAAAGFILHGMQQLGWEGTALEPNQKMADYARDQLNLRVLNTSLEDMDSNEMFDVISLVQVLPHFFDLRKSLDKLASLTNPKGIWLIETWNKDSWTAKISGKSWHEYSPPSVLHWFSPDTISYLTSFYGMKCIAKGRPSKMISLSHASSLFDHKYGKSLLGKFIVKGLSLFPDETYVPYPAEDLFWMVLEKE